MFNYHDLDDYEFEVLCRDIMERKLRIELRHFGKGVDGGIDLLDKKERPSVIIQVKHYIKSSFSSLRTALEKEVKKVEKLKPKRYYICCSCSQTITNNNINEIYIMFKDYMESKENIITLQDIDDFLTEEINKDIVRKNFKLWLSASSILSEIYNQHMFIDCDVLLYDINNDYKYYVQTSLYDKCKEIIDKHRAIMIVGSPGVGKTTISKMLILYYASKGYRVRYTTNGDISDIKNSLSSDKDCEEIVLLDDCLGQCYFNLKETKQEQLISLIKYIKNNSKKILILNSRVTIFNEAKKVCQDFDDIVVNDKIKIKMINMDETNIYEKAKIFFNHLYFSEVPREYYNSIRQNKNYMKIITHTHYNPRIIQYVTRKGRYSSILPKNYYKFIVSSLDNPKDVWENEFKDRIKSQDRILILVLFSLTENIVEYNVLQECYNKRLSLENSVDTSINIFEDVISRLNKSMIKIIDNNGEKSIGVLNPSINDYINNIFFSNILELDKIKSSVVYYEQIERCYNNLEEVNNIILRKINDGTVSKLKIKKQSEYCNINNLILYKICENSIINNNYNDFIHAYLVSMENSEDSVSIIRCKKYILEKLLKEPLCSAYDIERFIYSNKLIRLCYQYLNKNEILNAVEKIFNMIEKKNENEKKLLDLKLDIIECIKHQINIYLNKFDINEFLGGFDIKEFIEQNEYETYVNNDAFEELVRQEFLNDINDFSIGLNIKEIEEEVKKYISEKTDIDDYISRREIDSYTDAYMENYYDYDDDYDDDMKYDHDGGDSYSEIEAIFEGYI